MPFIKFTEPNKSFLARVSISPRGMLNFSDGARRRFKMDEYSHCVLYYDKETQLVGIEMVKDGTAEGSVKLRLRNTGADIGIKSFIDYFAIAPRKTSMYEIRAGDAPNWIVIDLKTARERQGG